MTMKAPFNPQYGSNQVVASGAASATITIATGTKQVRIVNTGANIAYVRVFRLLDGAMVATTADFPIAAGQASTITKGDRMDSLAHISAAGTTLQVMTGEGW